MDEKEINELKKMWLKAGKPPHHVISETTHLEFVYYPAAKVVFIKKVETVGSFEVE